MEAWKNLNPDVVFVKVAPTYVAAKQMRGGITCQAAVQRNVHNRFQVQVMVVDEVSMVSTNLLERMARWSIMGLKFVLLGDFSQLLPVGVDGNTRWRVEDSRTFMKLAGHLRIVLNQNRRAAADPKHFKRIMALRPMVDEPLDHIVPAFMQHYPWTGPVTQPIAYYICLSHRTRMRINRWQNVLEMNRQDRVLLVPSYGFQKGCSSQPQDMWIWPGLHLIGGGRTSRNVLNGVVYIVVNFTDEAITVKTHPDFTTDPEATIELPIREAAENLRLCYAAVYHSCQGRTLHNQHIMLMDTHHVHFTGRHLYVGASRVTEGQYLHIATRYITRWINDQIHQRVDNEDVEEPDVDALCGVMGEEALGRLAGPVDGDHHYDPTAVGGYTLGDWTSDDEHDAE